MYYLNPQEQCVFHAYWKIGRVEKTHQESIICDSNCEANYPLCPLCEASFELLQYYIDLKHGSSHTTLHHLGQQADNK